MWKEKLSQIKDLDITVSDILEKSATEEDRINHVDIADLLIRQHRKEYIPIIPVEEQRDPMKNPIFLKMKELGNIGNEKEVARLIEEMELEMVGVKRFGN